jgi:hypothetical protein
MHDCGHLQIMRVLQFTERRTEDHASLKVVPGLCVPETQPLLCDASGRLGHCSSGRAHTSSPSLRTPSWRAVSSSCLGLSLAWTTTLRIVSTMK